MQVRYMFTVGKDGDINKSPEKKVVVWVVLMAVQWGLE